MNLHCGRILTIMIVSAVVMYPALGSNLLDNFGKCLMRNNVTISAKTDSAQWIQIGTGLRAAMVHYFDKPTNFNYATYHDMRNFLGEFLPTVMDKILHRSHPGSKFALRMADIKKLLIELAEWIGTHFAHTHHVNEGVPLQSYATVKEVFKEYMSNIYATPPPILAVRDKMSYQKCLMRWYMVFGQEVQLATEINMREHYENGTTQLAHGYHYLSDYYNKLDDTFDKIIELLAGFTKIENFSLDKLQ